MIVEMQNVRESVWNSALREVEPKGTLFQSTYWAEYLRRTFGDCPIYLASLDKKGNIQGQLLAIQSYYAGHSSLNLYSRGGIRGKLYEHSIHPLFQKMLPSLHWENGPIIVSQPIKGTSEEKLVHQDILGAIVQIAQKLNCYAIKFARPAFFNDCSHVYSSFGFQKTRMGTILIDLNFPIEVLWRQVAKQKRRAVKRGMERGIEIIKVSNVKELKEFYDLHVEQCMRANVRAHPFLYFVSLWNHFSPLNKIVAFVVRLAEKPIGALLCLMHNEIIHLFALGDSDYARKNRLYANEAMIWHIIKWSKENGLKYFDHSGVELYKIDAGDEKARNICRFKLQWGGQIVEYHDYEKHFPNKRLVKLLKGFIVDPVVHN